MKKMSTNLLHGFRISFSVCIIGCLLSAYSGFGQTYLSNFTDPTGKYQIINASGTNCTAPPIQNAVGMADDGDSTFAFFTANTAEPFTCLSSKYSFATYLNLPTDSMSLDFGYQAGFIIRVPTGISLDTLRKYIVVSSYLDTAFQEYNDGGLLYGLDSNQNGVNWFIYFKSTKPFDLLELVVDPQIVPVNTDFEFDVLSAAATNSTVMPAEIGDFTLTSSGKNVSLSWRSLTETNVNSYTIERSSNGGTSYVSVGSVAAKGSSAGATSYSYTDGAPADGNYLYRIVTVNKDGSFKATNSLTTIIKGEANLFVYPSVVKAGQNVTIKTSETGLVTVQLFNAQGRLVKQQTTNSGGQFTIATNALSAGVYVVKAISASRHVLSSKIVVN